MTLKIEGQRFGRLVAIKPLRSEKKKVIWSFQCDCGNIAELPATYVVRLHTQSCGCYRVEQLRDAVSVDISGQRFGRLVALESIGSDAGRVQWRCKCDCGREVVRASKNLRNGTAVSCGCRKAEAAAENVAARVVDYIGQRFGRLTVVSLAKPTKSGEKRWKCRCDCGGSKIVRHGSLQSGVTISCGCVKKVRGHVPFMSKEARARSVVRNARRRAIKKGVGGSFSKQQVDELFKKQRGKCAWCHVKLTDKNLRRDHRKALANGGNNDIKNIELLCDPCNASKGAKDEIAWANECGKLL